MHDYKKILILIILTLIIGWGALLRLYKLGEQSYWIDEGYTLNAVLSTLEKGYPLLDSGQIENASYLTTYLIAGAVKIGGLNPVTTRSWAVIFGILMILLAYFWGKRFFNWQVGLALSFLLAFFYWEIAWSRQARMYIELQFFFILSLYLFSSIVEKFSYKKLFLLIITTLATILSHYFGYFLLLIYIFNLIFLINQDQRNKIKEFILSKKGIAISGFLSLIFIVILAKLSVDLIEQFSRERNILIGLSYQSFLLENLLLITVLGFFGMIISVLKRKNFKNDLLLVSAFFIPYFNLILLAHSQHFRYLFFILPILLVFCLYLLWFISEYFKNKYLIFVILVLVLVGFSNYLKPQIFSFSPISHYYLEPFTPQPDFTNAYQAIKASGWGDDKIIISPFTQMDKVYLGRSNYWLAMSLHGRPLDKEKVPERNFYNNAISITSKNQLEEIIYSNHGYIVIDEMALSGNRLDQDIIDYIGEQERIFSDNKPKYGIWVFKF
jgi:uncharacterized membrane protein